MRNSALTIVAPVAAALLAIGVVSVSIRWGASSSDVGEAFVSTPEFLFWLLVLGAQGAVCVVALPYVAGTVRGRARKLRAADVLPGAAVATIALAGLALVGTAAAFTLASRPFIGRSRAVPFGAEWPLPDHMLRVQPLVAFALVVGVLAVIGMWLDGVALTELSREASAPDLPRFVELRSEMNTLLAIAGVIIGLGTLASGLLREAVLATNEIALARRPADAPQQFVRIEDDPATPGVVESGFRTELEFDPQYVALYGLFFTVLLAIAFAPSYLALRAAGATLRDRTLPLPAPTDDHFDDISTKRKALDEFLQTRLTALASFKAGLAILSPLAGSVAALILDLPT